MTGTQVGMKHASSDMRLDIIDMNLLYGDMKHVNGDMGFNIIVMCEMQRRQFVTQFLTQHHKGSIEHTCIHLLWSRLKARKFLMPWADGKSDTNKLD
jgi:hypothetical protein